MRVLGLVAAAVVAVLAIASPASARDLRCNGAYKGKTLDDVTVPRGAACTLTGSTVRGDVVVLKNAYFQATATVVRGDVEGKRAQTVFIDTGSKVGGSVEAVRTIQFYVYNSMVGEDIELHVVGIGWAYLKGEGTFEVNNRGPFRWTPEGTFAGVASDQED